MVLSVDSKAMRAAYSALHAPVGYLIFLLFAIVCAAGTLGTAMKWVPRGEIFFILVFLVIAGIPLQRDGFWPAVAASAGGAGLSVLMTLLDAWSIPNPRIVVRRVRARASMGSATLDRKQHAIVVGAAAIAVTAAWVCADSLHIGHPFWAPVTVAAVMPALLSADVVQRTTRLLLGTLAGLGFAALLFAAEPRPLTLIAMIVACQALAELFITSSYAVALFFITPLAIGMSNLGRGLPWTPLIMERMTEAIVGSVVACATIIVGRILLAKEAPTRRTGTG
jgi:Fusaric acid resistance protein-like